MDQNLQLAADIFRLTIVSVVACWLFIRSVKRSENRPRPIFEWTFTVIVVGLVLMVAAPGFREGGEAALGALKMLLLCGLAMVVTSRYSIIQSIAGPLTDAIDGSIEPPGVKLGVYEQRVGLKHGPPRQ